jgi:hypothetical protein
MGNSGSQEYSVTKSPFYIYKGKAFWLTPESRVDCEGVDVHLYDFHNRGNIEMTFRNIKKERRWYFRIYPTGAKLVTDKEGKIYVQDDVYAMGPDKSVGRFYQQVQIFPDDSFLLSDDHITKLTN